MGTLGGLVGWLVIGVLAGFLANKGMDGSTSLGNDPGVGTFGAFSGGIIIRLLPFLHGPQTFNGSLVVAFAGACLLIAVRRPWARRRADRRGGATTHGKVLAVAGNDRGSHGRGRAKRRAR